MSLRVSIPAARQFNMHQTIVVCIGISLGALSTSSAWAGASALAVGTGDAFAWATAGTQTEANALALERCNAGWPKANCMLQHAKALAEATGQNRRGVSPSKDSLSDARKRALKFCDHPSCKITFETTRPGFYSWAQATEDSNGNAELFLNYATDNLPGAIKEAILGCEAQNGRKCTTVSSGVIPGVQIATKATEPMRSVEQSSKNCRPNTSQIRCTSQCTNGNCVITYENGCKMNVQVQAKFDPFSNQWKYPSPSC